MWFMYYVCILKEWSKAGIYAILSQEAVWKNKSELHKFLSIH